MKAAAVLVVLGLAGCDRRRPPVPPAPAPHPIAVCSATPFMEVRELADGRFLIIFGQPCVEGGFGE